MQPLETPIRGENRSSQPEPRSLRFRHLATYSSMALVAVFAFGFTMSKVVRAAEEITIVSWGGAYERSQVEAYFKPFTRKTGIQINIEKYDGGIDEIRKQVRRGDISWDLVDMTMADNMAACDEGLLERIDHSVLPPAPDGTLAIEDFFDGALTECGVAEIVYATVIAYNEKAFPSEEPSAIVDLFDIERFPGKRALQKAPMANLEWALMSYGVPREELYDLLSTERGLRLAFAKLDKIKDQVIWWMDGEQPVKLLVEGSVVLASGYNGRMFNAAVVQQHPIEIIWDAQHIDVNTWGIPKGTLHLQAVMEFIQFATDTRRLADQARYIAYGPARRSSAKRVSTHVETGVEMRFHMPTYPPNLKTAIRKDHEWYARIHRRINDRFNTWIKE